MRVHVLMGKDENSRVILDPSASRGSRESLLGSIENVSGNVWSAVDARTSETICTETSLALAEAKAVFYFNEVGRR